MDTTECGSLIVPVGVRGCGVYGIPRVCVTSQATKAPEDNKTQQKQQLDEGEKGKRKGSREGMETTGRRNNSNNHSRVRSSNRTMYPQQGPSILSSHCLFFFLLVPLSPSLFFSLYQSLFVCGWVCVGGGGCLVLVAPTQLSFHLPSL